jgi:oligopeptide/dipeptide ABC transporter ATP-binding protein
MAKSMSPHIKLSESTVSSKTPKPLLCVEDLVTTVLINDRNYNAVDHVSFSVNPGEVLGLVGESAAGKSMTALSIIRLIRPPAQIVSGRVIFDGTDLLTLSEPEMSKLRGREIAMVSQDPMTALNPVKTIGDQLTRVIRLHTPVSKDEATRRAIDMMSRVGIPAPAERLRSYPHQFSGGMLQRISIAMALSCNPKLLIADEPTTALDVTIQAKILELLQSLRNDFGMAVLLITHNLGVVAEFCDRVAVMYAGKIVEDRVTRDLVRAPRHPYAEGLLSVSPSLDQDLDRLPTIKGRMPSLQRFPAGCRFHPRCPYAFERCPVEIPALLPLSDGSRVACHLYDGNLERTEHPAAAETEKRS